MIGGDTAAMPRSLLLDSFDVPRPFGGESKT